MEGKTARKVVVTGMGVICPVGNDVATMWQSLISGHSGADYITLFDPEPFETRIAAEVKSFDPLNYIERKPARHMDRFTQFAVASSIEAVSNAQLKITQNNGDQIGVLIGSGIGGLSTLFAQTKVLLEQGPDRVSPFLIPMMIADGAAGQVSITLGTKGPSYCAVSSCASGADAIGEAMEIIRRGEVEVMIAGGSEAAITPIGIAAFSAAGALSRRNAEPKKACRPFDASRDGFVMGEGAAILVMESLEFALNRGAPIIAEILGYGATSDAYHITQPEESGLGGARALQIALKKAGITTDEVDYINAHGTSTMLNDRAETRAIKTVFGERAYKVPISSTKSTMGHLLGAAGAIEAAVCCLVMKHNVIPPTINLERADEQCDLDYVPGCAREKEVNVAMSNSFGFGGHNSVLIFRKFSG